MQYINAKFKAACAAERWKEQYHDRNGGWKDFTLHDGRLPRAIYDKLLALGDTPEPAQVYAVIGTTGWASIWCNECSSYKSEAIIIGSEDGTALCRSCLVKALALLSSPEKGTGVE